MRERKWIVIEDRLRYPQEKQTKTPNILKPKQNNQIQKIQKLKCLPSDQEPTTSIIKTLKIYPLLCSSLVEGEPEEQKGWVQRFLPLDLLQSPPILARLPLNPNPNNRWSHPLSLPKFKPPYLSLSFSKPRSKPYPKNYNLNLKRKRNKRKPRERERDRKMKIDFGTVFEFCVYWWCCVWLAKKFKKKWESYYKFFS